MPGLTIHESQQDCAEIALQGRAALQLLQHLLGIGIPSQFHHHPHAFAITFIADVGNAADFPVIDGFGKFFDPAGFTQLIRQFGDDNRVSLVASFPQLNFFDMSHSSHRNAASTIEIGLFQSAAQEHFPAGGEIWAGNELQQFFIAQFRLADQGDQAIHNLPKVVGRNAGGHPHGNA